MGWVDWYVVAKLTVEKELCWAQTEIFQWRVSVLKDCSGRTVFVE